MTTPQRQRAQTKGTIVKRDHPVWKWGAAISLGSAGGKRRRKWFYGRSRDEVRRKLHEALAETDAGRPPATGRDSYGEWLQFWLDNHIAKKRRPKTATSYRQLVKDHIGPGLGAIPLARLDVQQIETFLADKSASDLSPRTVAYLHAVIRSSLTHAKRKKKIHYNPARDVEPIHVETFEAHPLTVGQVKALLEAAEKERLKPLFVVMLYAGLRPGEALALRWADIDFETGTIHVRHDLQRVAKQWELLPPKTKASQAPVPMTAPVLSALQQWRAQQKRERLFFAREWKDTIPGLVFTTTHGTPTYSRNATRTFKRLLTAAKLPLVTRLHDLRHSCGSLHAAMGTSQRQIMSLLRHTQLSTTTRYTKIAPEVMRGAADALAKLLEPA